MASLNLVNVFAEDIVQLARFYRQVFGFREIRAYRSPIFRCLDAGKAALGFNAREAYALLGLERHRHARGVKMFINIEMRSKRAVDEAVTRALARGARLVKAPYVTYYGFYQAVLFDPEANVFRVNRVLQRPARTNKAANKSRR